MVLRMNLKTKIIIGLIVAVVVVVVVVAAFFLLGGLFESPVDTSGVNPPTTLETEELLPAELAGNQLDNESVDTGIYKITVINVRYFYVDHTEATYDGITIEIIEADSIKDASDTFEVIYVSQYESVSGSHTKTSDWFQCDVGGVHVFYWRSGKWVFGVEAGDSDTMTQAAEDLVEHLSTFS